MNSLSSNPIIFQIQLKWIITSIIWITALASAIMTYFEMKDELRFQIKFKVYDKQVKKHLLIAASSNPNLLATCLRDLQKNPTKEKYVQKFKHLFCLVLLTTFIIMFADFPTAFDLNSLAYLLGKILWIRGLLQRLLLLYKQNYHSPFIKFEDPNVLYSLKKQVLFEFCRSISVHCIVEQTLNNGYEPSLINGILCVLLFSMDWNHFSLTA